MEDYKKSGERRYSSEGKVLRPRKKVYTSVEGGERRSYGEHKNFNSNRPRRTYGERPYSSNGERRSFSNSEEGGERRSFNSDRPRRNYGDRPYGGGDRRKFNSDRPQRSYYNDRAEGNGERRSFSNNEEGGERRSFNSDRPRRNYGDKPYSGGAGFKRPAGSGYKNSGNGGFSKNGRGGSFQKKRNASFHFDESEGAKINKMIDKKPLDISKFSDNDQAPTEIREEIRLNKFIANSGVCSRREADTLIQAGVVTVNGEVVTELGTKVNIIKDDVRFNGQRLKGEEKVYLVMNKPKGFVTTASDPHADKTVMDLIKDCTSRVFPVGRLDKATTGVLMFTNDGEMAEKLTHPSYDKKKIYQVILDHPLTEEDRDKILSGITLGDGDIAADELEYIDENDHRKLGIEIHSGKNRIVRRIFDSLGYDVQALDRVYFAGLTKKGLQKGEWRYLTDAEVNILKIGAYM